MKRVFECLAVAVLLGLAALPARAAGIAFVTVPADAQGPQIDAAVWSPCATPPGTVMAGRTPLSGNLGCAVEGDHLPLVVISHGFMGSFVGHRDTAEALANAGFIVAALNHPADSGRSSDKSRMYTLSALTERPTDIKRLIDFMLTGLPQSPKIDPARIGFFGFSRGGFTGLALIGGDVDYRAAFDHWCKPETPSHICDEMRQNGLPTSPLTHDARIKAAVIADPFLGSYFTVKSVQVPVQLWASEQGGDGVLPDDPATVAKTLPAKPDYHVVAHTAHFAFLAPCNPGEMKVVPQICTDAPDFDRVAFHKDFDDQIVAFFRAHL